MGLFGDIWSGVKKVGHSLGKGVQKIGHAINEGSKKVSKVGHKIKDTIDKGYKIAKKIPVVGEAVDRVVNTQFIPGVSIGKVADIGNLALKGVDAVGEGGEILENIGGAIDGKDTKGFVRNTKDLQRFGKKFNKNHIQPFRNVF